MSKNGPSATVIIGILLIIVGVGSRVLTGTSSITALIPAFFGVPIALLGWLALAPQRTRWSMIIASLLALLGVFGTYSVVGNLTATLQGDPLSAATVARGSMLLLCSIQLIVGIVSILRFSSD